ncbi:choice-of-anchor G family protein, partial [Glutamicibacter ardleyensis]
MQAKQTPTKQRSGPRAARRVLAGAVVTALFTAPTVTAAFAAPTDDSEAFGQVINVDGLGLDVADAGYSFSANPSSKSLQKNPLNLSALNGVVDLTLPTINLPVISDDGSGLLELGQAGALSSYAIADTATHAKGSSGVLDADGALAVDQASGDMATIDLTKLFGQLGVDGVTTDVLSVAELRLGALGSTAERTDGDDPELEYRLAAATVDLESPLVSTLGEQVTGLTSELGTVLDGLVGAGGLTTEITNAINGLNVNVLGIATADLSNAELTVNGLEDVTGTLNALVTEELVSESELVSVNLGDGTVHIDLSKAIGGGLNDQPANTKLLDDAIATQISTELTTLLDGVAEKLTTAVNEMLDQATFTLTADADASILVLDVLNGGINVSGSLGDLLSGNIEALNIDNDLVVLGALAGGINAGDLANLLVESILELTGPIFNGANALIDNLADNVQSLVADVVAPVIDDAIEPLLAGVVEITINEQGTIASSEVNNLAAAPAAAQIVDPAPEGELNYVTALAIDVLPDAPALAVGVDLATSAVRAAAEATVVPVEILKPTDGQADVPVGDVIVSGTTEPLTDVVVTLDDGDSRTVTADENGDWSTTFENVGKGSHTAKAVGESVDNTDSVTFTVVEENTADNTAENTEANTGENTDANTEANTGENTDVNTEANTG